MEPSPQEKSSRCGGRKAGAKGYRAVEIMKLLRIIEALQPVGTEGWRRATNLYNKWAQETGVSEREMENLRKKYKSLTRFKPEEGVTQIPEEVKEARRIEKLILDRISGKDPLGGNALGFADDDDTMKLDGDDDDMHDGRSRARRSTLNSLDYQYAKNTRHLENSIMGLVEKLDNQNKEMKDLQSMIRSFLESQHSTVNALVQQNQQLMVILVQGQKGTSLFMNPHGQGPTADGGTQ
mmetsp:Transcript_3258/g.9959  ORF Transcript_3258/g.9959 Transcript_3258/m.9959 type:complete len:237 (+) Transcript_3258:120-830(+)|eukprot:CAMPEP_0198729704 /NCGR_PEP_ID=MMETSP1475-20131203/20579_1 /TAXON_ID= ORGANISM="Unidentified sp., Strain CCMP1999" /NCGR_SAMPLE_ID=MMETSP1475 /ASSEMBLY_ACC=CAM_ASM_001111 /LENGTH=236 /DNA_ID=CAMNT_0044492405 /DNA_START=54 /DNA_END=764 /DNA_ORIENTATION=+